MNERGIEMSENFKKIRKYYPIFLKWIFFYYCI